MTLRDYLVLLRRGWLILAICTALGLGVALSAINLITPTWTSSAEVLITTAGQDETAADLAQSNVFATSRAATYAALAQTDEVLAEAAAATGDEPGELAGSLTTAAREGTSILDISATASSPALAAARANAVADTLASQAGLIDAPSAGSTVRLAVVSRAEEPTVATAPRSRNLLVIGTVVGLALGVALVVVLQTLDTRIRNAVDVPRQRGVTTVTSLPTERERARRGARPGDLRLESFRHLRSSLQFSSPEGRSCIAVAGVTHTSDAESVAAQLASVLSETGVDVALVDADFRRGGTRRRGNDAQAQDALGVADVLAGRASLDDVMTPGAAAGVWVVPAGVVEAASAQLLSSAPVGSLFEQLRERFSYVVFQCPPVTERSEAAIISALSDTTLLVVESAATRRTDLAYALELLEGVGVTSTNVAVDHVSGMDLGRSRRS